LGYSAHLRKKGAEKREAGHMEAGYMEGGRKVQARE